MELSEIRTRIDSVDDELVRLFTERMDLAAEVAASKRGTGKPVYDAQREREKLADIAGKVPGRFSAQAVSLFSLIMSISKAEQLSILAGDRTDARSKQARAALQPLDEPFPEVADVACQGVEGAYSQIAATRLFRVPRIQFFNTFEGVFRAVREGLCAYGVLPIENSTAGSVNRVYDLMAEYRFNIARSLRLKINHDLLAPRGVGIGDIREVYSHEQALAQCQHYLDKLGVKVHVVENTAKAAAMIAGSDRRDVAAISSRDCARLYGLDVLDESVQDSDSNYTRFVVVSAEPKIFPGATRTSLMLTTGHEPGSLYRVLERFYAFGVNIVKLESRPIPGRDFEYLFYFDLECAAAGEKFSQLLDALDDVCDTVTYFGSYAEVV